MTSSFPGRDIGQITIQEILEVARNQRSGHFAARGPDLPAVDRLSARLEKPGANAVRDAL